MDNQLELVPFEVAKKLEILGFNWSTKYNVWIYDKEDESLNYVNEVDYKTKYIDISILAPELELVSKWFRDVHNIIIEANYSKCEFWIYKVMELYKYTIILEHSGTNKTDDVNLNYEQALLNGIKEAIKIIKND